MAERLVSLERGEREETGRTSRTWSFSKFVRVEKVGRQDCKDSDFRLVSSDTLR
jgi:hypothetical protein